MVFFSFIKPSFANISSDFINNITVKASNILSGQDSQQLKVEKLIKIGEEAVDIEGIGFYTLGKHKKN